MARDINKLKDRLHAVKGLDSASAYNAQDEDERKKKQAAQLKSDAQINAARQAGEQARLAAIEKNKKILRENREANVQAQKQATAKSNANRAVSPGIEDTISRKQQLTDAMVQLRDWGSGKGDKWQSNNDFQTAYNAYENAMSWAEQSEAAGDIDAAKYMREAASYLAKWGNIAGTELTKLTDQYGSFENAEAYRNGDRSGYREYLNRDKSWKEIDSHIKELEKTIESTSDLKRRSEYMEELDWYNNYARNNYTEAAETELDLLRRKQDTLQNALAQSEINNSPLNGTPVDDSQKSETLKRFDEDIEAAKAANMNPWYISALEKARESFAADASPVSYEQNWQDIDRYDELSGRIGGLNDQIASAKQSLEMAKTAEWERNNRIKYAALEQEMNAANWYFDNYDYENFKELVTSEKNSAAAGMPYIYTLDVRDQYTKEEASIYMYLREKGRVEEADAFANYMQSTAAGRRNQQIEQRFAEEDIGIVGRTIVAIAANPGKIANTIDINLQKLGNVLGDEYIPIDYETTGNFGVASNVNREIATQELAALGTLNDALGVEIPYIGSYTLGDLYGTGVDSLNSAMNVALFGTGAAGTALAAEKFSDEYRAAKERGGTDDQAFNYAWGSSIAEGVGEQIVLDRYLGFLTKLGRNPGKAAAIMAGIISVAEGGVQEAATTVMENAVDKWTMGENSEFNIAVRRYEAMGYEHGTAEQMAIDEMNREILKSGIMGALGQGAPVAGGYAAQGISKAAGSVQTAIDDAARGSQIQNFGNAQQMAQLMGEVTGETVTPEKSKRKLGKQQREFIENAGEYVSGADETTRDIVRGKVYDVANASAEALDGTSQAAKVKAGKRSAAMKTSDTGASVGGESVTVQGFVKTAEKGSDAKLNIKKADGTLAEANMEDVTFDSKSSEVYSYAADMATPELANDFRMRIQPDQMGSIERVANGYSQAYDMARAGFKEVSVRTSSLTGALTDEQVSAAYKLGAEARKSAQIAAITKAAERAKANMGNAWKGGKASFDDSVVVDALDDTQKAQIDVASVFTGSMGVNVVFFESKADETGRFTRENGSYNRRTNTIYIDVNAGRYYKGDSPSKTALLRTLSHEVTHAVQRNSPEIYAELRDTVTDILGDAKGVTIEDLIDRKMAADSSLIDRDAAMDELVADACERMIEDSDAAQRLAEAHPEAAKTIFQKVGELLKKIGDSIKAAFKGRQLSTEAQLVMKDVERYQKMVDLWTKGVMETTEVSGREHVGATVSEMETVTITEETAAEGEEVTSGEAVGLFDEPARIAETHIDNRTWENVGDRSVKAFMNEYRGARSYMYPALQVLRSDVRDSTRGERLMIRDEEGYAQGMTGQQRETTDQIAELKDQGYTWEQVSETLDMLENELRASGEENMLPDTAIVKRIELALDDMLTNGYDSLGGGMGVHYAPDAEYIRYKSELPGAKKYAASQMEQADGRQFVDDVQFQTRDGIEFLEDKYFIKRLENFAEEKQNGYLRVGKILEGSVLHQIGLPAEDLFFDNGKISTNLNAHGDHLDIEVLSKIPSILRDPTVIVEYKKDNINVYGEIWVKKSPLMIAIMVTHARSGASVINKIRTVYAQRNAEDFINDNSVLYLNEDKKRTRAWFQASGTHLPLGGTKFGFIRSISLSEHLVNPDIQKQTREEAISTRFVLANMLEADATNSEEVAWLRGYKGQLNELDKVLDAIEGNRQTVRELMFEEKTLSDGKKKLVMRKRTPDETERLKKAQNRIKILQEQVARIDEGLLNLENADVIRNLVAREERKIRDREAEKRREGVAKIQESHRTQAIRKNVIRRAKRLDKMLREPTAKDHIPDRLKAAMVDMLQTFTDTKGGDAFGGDRISRERLQHAKLGYDQMFKEYAEDYPQLAAMYDEATSHRLMELSELLDGRRLYDLNFREITELSNVVGHFEKIVSDANEEFDENRKNSIKANAMEMHDTMATMEGRKENYFNGNMLAKSLRELKQGQITPPYFFKRLGGSLGRLGTELLKGEGKYGVNAQRAAERVAEIKNKYNYDKWADKKNDRIKIKTEEGQELALTREEALGIWATQKRETRDKYHQTSHLSQGGVVIDKRAKKLSWRGEIDNRNPIRLTKTDVAHIAEQLTDEQMSYADEMVGYISRDLAELGNETSMELMGYKVFGEGYYYPYRTSSDFLPTKLGDAEAALIRNMGFTKAVTRRAKTPIVITDFTTTVTEHISNMLMYNALAVSQDRFMRVFDYKFDDGKSIKSMLGTTYGPELQKYIVQFMNDVYGGKATKKAPLSKMTSLHKKQAVLASMSVVVQQPTAVMRAMSMVNPKYFLAQGAKVTTKAFEEAKHYAGTAVIKDMGRFDTGIGRTAGEYIAGTKTEGMRNWIDDAAGWLAGKADEWGWSYIWDAVKREQAAKTGLDIKSEELKMIAGERFDEVVRYTQVYDSVMTKSELMRSKDGLTQMITSFMAEPTVTYNMMLDMVQEFRHGSKKKAGAVLGSVVGSIILANAAKALWVAFRDDDDDDDKTLWEHFFEKMASGMANDINPLNYIPVVKDLYSILQGYDVERSDVTAFTDLVQAIKIMSNEDKDVEQRWKSALTALGLVTDVPIKNLWRDMYPIGKRVYSLAKGERWREPQREGAIQKAVLRGVQDDPLINLAVDFMSETMDLFSNADSRKEYVEELYEAALADDNTMAARMRGQMKQYVKSGDGYIDDKGINSELRTRIKDGFTAGEIGADEAIELLTGYAGVKRDDASDKVLEWQYAIDNDGSSYSDMRERYLEGEISYDDAVSDRVQYGGVESDKAKATVDKWEFERLNGYAYEDLREEHADGNVSSAEAMEIMQDYGGKDANEAYWEVAEWDYGDGWDGKGTLLNDAFASGSETQVRSRMQGLAGHSDWQKPGNELASYVTDYYKPIYEAAPAAQKDALRQTILGYLKMAYEVVGEEYYGDDYALRYRSWLKK